MQLYEILAGAQNGRAIENLARACGVPTDRMEAAVKVVARSFAQNIERNTLSRGGLADFVAALGDGHHEYILDNPQALKDPRVRMDGNDILEHVLGTKDRSRALTASAARASGLSEGLIKMLLPIIAQWVMGAISKWARGNLGDVIARTPGSDGQSDKREDERETGSRKREPGFELPRSEMPRGPYPLPPIPGGDGEPMPRAGRRQDEREAEREGGPFSFPFPFPGSRENEDAPEAPAQIPWPRRMEQPQRRPWDSSGGFDLPRSDLPQGPYPMPPIPGGSGGGSEVETPAPRQPDNPYGDLSDILRRGGRLDGAPAGRTIRDMLGGLLGFGSSGFVGWLLRLLFMRFGWNLMKRILGRVLLGR